MKYYALKISLAITVFSMVILASCTKKTADVMTDKETVKLENVTTSKVDKSVGYFKYGLVGTEVIDSAGDMVGMMDMMAEMMLKEIESEFMVNGNLFLEYNTDVEGNMTNFSIFNSETGTKEAYGELDMEKVYTVYSAEDSDKFDIPEGANITESDETKNIHGYHCNKISMKDDSKEMEMVLFYTEEMAAFKGLPNGKKGFPLEVQLIMGGAAFITGVVEYSPTLPKPEFFNVDKSQYRKVTNEEFPTKGSMF